MPGSSSPVVVLAALTPPPAVPVQVPALVANTPVELVGAGCVLLGWSLLAGTTATDVTFYDGPVSTGVVAARVTITAEKAASALAGPAGVLCRNSLVVQASAATLASAVWVLSPLG